tara:strand:+ start:5199 stop:6017 length:819 start_codon:yes stop_codon:yes gene_type:complete
MPIELSKANNYQRQHPSFLLVGPAGSGKTMQLKTIPGKKLVFAFEQNSINTLAGDPDISYKLYLPDDVEIATRSLSSKANQSGRVAPDQGVAPNAYEDFRKDFNEVISSKQILDFDVVAIDSLTSMSKAIMDRILYINNRMGCQPQQDDWSAQIVNVENVVRKLTSLPILLYATAHDELKRDDMTGKQVMDLVLTGQLKTRVPMLFSDIYKCMSRSTEAEDRFVLVTRPDEQNMRIRRSFENVDYYVDATIKDMSKPHKYGLGSILAQSKTS